MRERRERIARAWPGLASVYRSGRLALQRLDAATHHGAERARIAPFRNQLRGTRCFVIGNGPSLRSLDLAVLANEVTFVVNHVYWHPRLDALQPTFYCVSDLAFFDDRIHPGWREHLAMLPAATVPFLPIEVRRRVRAAWSGDRAAPCFVRHDRTREVWREGTMSVDATGVLGTGDSVILDLCLPLAHFMGCAAVYLVGCDTDYGHGDHAAHFYDAPTPSRPADYHRHVWYDHVVASSTIARRVFEATGRGIFNATPGGRLDVFPRVSLEEVLA